MLLSALDVLSSLIACLILSSGRSLGIPKNQLRKCLCSQLLLSGWMLGAFGSVGVMAKGRGEPGFSRQGETSWGGRSLRPSGRVLLLRGHGGSASGLVNSDPCKRGSGAKRKAAAPVLAPAGTGCYDGERCFSGAHHHQPMALACAGRGDAESLRRRTGPAPGSTWGYTAVSPCSGEMQLSGAGCYEIFRGGGGGLTILYIVSLYCDPVLWPAFSAWEKFPGPWCRLLAGGGESWGRRACSTLFKQVKLQGPPVSTPLVGIHIPISPRDPVPP